MAHRTIPRISLHDFSTRQAEVTAALVTAASTSGFFALTNHGISSTTISAMFATAERFFALPNATKATVPFSHVNAGWEVKSQIRPSTGAPDQKESYQLQFGANMEGLWLDEQTLPGFRAAAVEFMYQAQAVSEMLMLCFARGLGFPDDFFIKAHDVSRPDAQSVLRLLHYFALDRAAVAGGEEYYRAGAHADWDFITLLFQLPGSSGLEICPGREAVTSFGMGDEWTPVTFAEGEIVCNIGDMLMSWSDDRFKSTFHRVKTPVEEGDWWGPRYSIAFFNQPVADVVIRGREGKYPAMTAREFTLRAMRRNYEALEAKKREKETVAKGS